VRAPAGTAPVTPTRGGGTGGPGPVRRRTGRGTGRPIGLVGRWWLPDHGTGGVVQHRGQPRRPPGGRGGVWQGGAVNRFLVTGVSGAGKTTVARQLCAWGHHAVSADSDTVLCGW
jgi:hypothetical protein